MDAIPHNHRLFGARLKYDRAFEHYNAACATIEQFIESKPHRFETKIDADSEMASPVFRADRKIAPALSVVLGEVIYNLRCALDYYVFELFFLNKGTECTSKKAQFPIFETECGFNLRGMRMVDGLSTDAVAIIKSVQPFATKEGTNSPLWHLQHLSNRDKHRTLNVTSTAVAHMMLKMGFFGMGIGAHGAKLKDGTELGLSFPIPPGPGSLSERAQKMPMDMQVGVQFSFEDYPRLSVQQSLRNIAHCVWEISNRFNVEIFKL